MTRKQRERRGKPPTALAMATTRDHRAGPAYQTGGSAGKPVRSARELAAEWACARWRADRARWRAAGLQAVPTAWLEAAPAPADAEPAPATVPAWSLGLALAVVFLASLLAGRAAAAGVLP